MIKIKNTNYILIILFIISIGANFLAWQKIGNFSDITKNKEAVNQTQIQELKLIENEYTSYLDNFSYNIPEEWETYRNEKYGFEINYPKEFSEECRSKGNCFRESKWKKVKIQEVDFNEDKDFYAKQNENKISDNAYFTFGSFKTARHIIDFNVFEKEEIWDNKTYQVESSLFAIVIHPNESNLSFEDFMSQEILNMPEGIEEQRVVKINGVEGYRVVLPAIHNAPSSIVYYLPSKNNETIISIGTPVDTLREHPPYGKLDDFIESYPQYQERKNEMRNCFLGDDYNIFLKKYPVYTNFIEQLSAKHAEKELYKRLIFEKIVYSFKFN